MVVLPAASRPTIRILISFLANSRLKSFPKVSPISVRNAEVPAKAKVLYSKRNVNDYETARSVKLFRTLIIRKSKFKSTVKKRQHKKSREVLPCP